MAEKKRKGSRVDLTSDKFEMEVAEELGLANKRKGSQASQSSSKVNRAHPSHNKGQVGCSEQE